MRNLHVWSDSTHIGVFSQRSGGSPVRFEYDDAKGDYEVKYRLTKLISSEEKVSEGIPDK